MEGKALITYRIGDWTFDAASGELRRGAERRRLEHRAARTLQLLAEADGAIVPQDEIIERVWGGRCISGNSVPVVISQLRRLLEDDARRPLLIETVPKRGYRLLRAGADGREAGGAAAQPRAAWLALGTGMLLVLAAAVAWLGDPVPAKPTLAVTDVANATGNAAYAPLARATSELVVNQLSRRGYVLRRDGRGDLALSSKLVLWDGEPYLGMTATDAGGVVRWSAMIRGSAGRIPDGVSRELDRFERLAPAGGHR